MTSDESTILCLPARHRHSSLVNSLLVPSSSTANGAKFTGDETSPVYQSIARRSHRGSAACAARMHVDEAVEAAAAAFPAWRDTPPVERARLFFRYRQLVEENFDRICESVSREHGKTLAEARGSAYRGIENVEYACGVPTLLMGDTLENLARGVDCETMLQPLGVCVGITPFNFPAMVPMWMFPLALACGNTFVLKPSEKVPLTVVADHRACSKKPACPKACSMSFTADANAVDALLTHPKVKAISFVGSSPVAKYIYETGTRHGKRVQANGGAKNYIVVMPDADVDADGRSAFDRGVRLRRRTLHGRIHCDHRRQSRRSRFAVAGRSGARDQGRPDRRAESQPDMGPVITAQHRDRVLEFGRQRRERRRENHRRWSRRENSGCAERIFHRRDDCRSGAGRNDDRARRSFRSGAERDAHGQISTTRSNAANKSAYGNGAAIFTNSGKAAREFKNRVKAGMVGINVGVPATMAMFPFTGWDESFYGDLHIQGKEGVQFYTQQKVVTTRWFGDGVGRRVEEIDVECQAS